MFTNLINQADQWNNNLLFNVNQISKLEYLKENIK